jgi:carboxyl-terminal processing protease
MLMRLIANVIDQDLKVADEKRRKETKELITKSRGKDAYAGKIVVLIDSGSASASEIFARVIQLEKRGLILGDRSAGAVMESRYFGRQSGMDTVIFYGASVTIADLIMKDGKSLEKNGVVPDVTIIPTGKDVAARRDVALAKALESVGVTITPEVAGSIFPEDVDDID